MKNDEKTTNFSLSSFWKICCFESFKEAVVVLLYSGNKTLKRRNKMKSTILAVLGIVFMIISMLIMMNDKVALIVTMTLWFVFIGMSLISRYKERKNMEN